MSHTRHLVTPVLSLPLVVTGLCFEGDGLFSPVTYAGFDSLAIAGRLTLDSRDELIELHASAPALVDDIEAALNRAAQEDFQDWQEDKADLRRFLARR
jgi:hypothetical protein